MEIFMLLMGAVVGGTCGALVFKVTRFADELTRLERKLESLQDQISRATIAAANLKTNFDKHETCQKNDLHRVTLSVYDMGKKLSALEDKVSDAYDVVEAKAKQEKLMFEGLSAIMDYDVSVARKAVTGDGEG